MNWNSAKAWFVVFCFVDCNFMYVETPYINMNGPFNAQFK